MLPPRALLPRCPARSRPSHAYPTRPSGVPVTCGRLRRLATALAAALAVPLTVPLTVSGQAPAATPDPRHTVAEATPPARRAAADPPARPAAPPTERPAAPRARRPDFQTLRFEEQWPVAAAYGGHGALDALKHLRLAPGGWAYLTVGGQLRVRGEAVSHFQLGRGDARQDAFEMLRASLTGDLHLGAHTRLFAELRDATTRGRELPGGARPQDHDRWDVQTAFVELTCCARTASPRLRLGRQELSLGRERLLGVADWSNARRAFSGARLDLRAPGSIGVSLLHLRPVALSSERPNRDDPGAVLWGGLATRRARNRATLEGFALALEQRRATLGTFAGAHHRVTVGGRGTGPLLARPWLTYDVEGGVQRGRLGDARVAAWYLASELSAAARRLPLAPTLTLGYDVASGDRDSSDATSNTFHHLYTSAHAHYGLGDVVGRQNATNLRLGVAAAVPVLGQVAVVAHDFRRVSTQDAAYAKAGGVLRARSADGARALGHEVDLTLSRPIGRHVRLVGGYAQFTPGPYLWRASGGASPMDWGFSSIALTF